MELHVVLYEPEIPQNTGSIGRTCVAIGAQLHLIEPLGYSLDNKYRKRAGLDYWQHLDWKCHKNWADFSQFYPTAPLWYLSTKATQAYNEVHYGNRVFLVFGKESAGLPNPLLEASPERCIRLPIREETRSLNISVAVGIASFEVLRQNSFQGLALKDPERRIF